MATKNLSKNPPKKDLLKIRQSQYIVSKYTASLSILMLRLQSDGSICRYFFNFCTGLWFYGRRSQVTNSIEDAQTRSIHFNLEIICLNNHMNSYNQ